MSTVSETGFTLIETMLFLAITGLMIAGMLAGSWTSINSQRYHDSVSSLQAELQDQFSKVDNSSNSIAGGFSCNDQAQLSTGTTERGQSNCYILGRYVYSTTGAQLNESTVIGYISPTDEANLSTTTTDYAALTTYTLNTVSNASGVTLSGTSVYTPEWGATMQSMVGGNRSEAFSLLIVRSPTSGTIRSFVDPNSGLAPNPTNLKSLINQTYVVPLNLCVSGGNLGPQSDVQVIANAANVNGVQTLGDGEVGNQCN